MSSRFSNLRTPAHKGELEALDIEQLILVVHRQLGEPATAADVYDETGKLLVYEATCCDVVDEQGTPQYRIWVSDDGGLVLRAGSTHIVGDIIQFGFGCDDVAAWTALATADKTEVLNTPIGHISFDLEET